jgi:hypothetical protein
VYERKNKEEFKFCVKGLNKTASKSMVMIKYECTVMERNGKNHGMPSCNTNRAAITKNKNG